MNKQPGSTLVTTINVSRSCYKTTNRFTFLSVESKFARTIDISKNILKSFCTLFKNVDLLTKRQEKGICLFFKRNNPHLAHRRALRKLIITPAERLKSLFRQAKHFVFGQYSSPVRIKELLSYAQTVVNVALHIVIALKNVTLVSNKKSTLVEMFDFAVTPVDNFCKNELITVLFKLFDGKDASLIFFSNRNDNRSCLFNFSAISL